MNLSFELLSHAAHLLDTLHPLQSDVVRRRAVSASYYALFHQINGDAADLIAPNVTPEINHRIQRWFNHGEMKQICGRFAAAKLTQPLLSLVGPKPSMALQTVASSFIQLQEARHSADYDLELRLTGRQAHQYLEMAKTAIIAWKSIAGSAEANIFILSLLMWKNWDKER